MRLGFSMSFRKNRNRHDEWVMFCAEHRKTLEASQVPDFVFRAEAHFRELLEHGQTVDARGGSVVELDKLSHSQWHNVSAFVRVFFREFESYAPFELFPPFRREVEKRSGKNPHVWE